MTPKRDPNRTADAKLDIAAQPILAAYNHEASWWVDAQGHLKFIQNSIMREVQKFVEHK